MRLPSPLLLLPLLCSSAWASVLAIDYGAEFTKISLVKPGLPMDVVLNKDSKRKVQSVVGWKKDERLFGGEAAAVSGRFPHDTFPYLKPHLGHPHSDDTTTLFPSVITPTLRKTVGFTRSSGKEDWSVEELIGMQFSYARSLAEDLAGEAVKDAVVSVPGWFNQFERQAVIDALEIGGLKSLGLINDGTAVAMNYAMTRLFPTKEHHLIYDSGSLSTSATVISFHTYLTTPVSALLTSTNKKSKFKPKQVNTTHIEVLGLGWDSELGGTTLDNMIKDQLVDEFETKVLKGKRITGKEREKAMAKVAKEAAKVKSVLSANSDSSVNIESFFDDHDYRSRFTREQLETSAASIINEKKYEKPIWDALKMANLTVADLDSLILFGGNSRVPMVQAAIKAAVGENKIAQNVNTDEAAVLGAAFYGATQSRQFKTKEVKVIDLTPYDIQTSYLAEAKSATDKPRTIHTLLFPVGSKTLVKKTLKLKRKADFDLAFSYRNPSTDSALPFPSEITTTKITGLTKALSNLTEAELALNPDPVVRVTIQLNESGMVQVVEATAILEAPKVEESLGSRLKGLFGGGKGGDEGEAEAEILEKIVEEEEKKAEEEKKEKEKANGTAAEEKKEDKLVEKLVPLKVAVEAGEVKAMTTEEKNASRTRLLVIDAAELAHRAREEAQNILEGYLYRLRGMLDPEQEGSIFWETSTEDEREKLQSGMRSALEWLEEEGWKAPTKELTEKRKTLEAIEVPIQFRNTEAQNRAGALEKFQQALYAGRAFVQSHAANLTALAALPPTDPPTPEKYTEDEVNAVKLTMAGLEEWLGRLMDVQKGLKPNEDPVMLVSELEKKGVKFQELVMGLLKRKDPVPPKKTTGKKEKAGKKGEEVKVEGEEAEEVKAEETPVEEPKAGGEEKEETKGEEEVPPVHTKDEL